MNINELVRTYAGLVMHDEGDHWVLTWFGRPIVWGDEESVGRAHAYLCLRLSSALEAMSEPLRAALGGGG